MANVTRFRYQNVPRQSGEQARLRVVQGPDYGSVYVITSSRVLIGRGEENDVVISDLKASRRHAELQQSAGGWKISDAGSANGILVNGQSSRSSPIRTRDHFSLGETTLEFVDAEAGDHLLLGLPGPDSGNGSQDSVSAAVFALNRNVAKGPKLIAAAAAAVILAVFVFPSEKAEKAAKSPGTRAPSERGGLRDLASYLPGAGAPEEPRGAKSAEMFFRSGFREYRERNFLRAQAQFETALQLSPNHSLARLYLDNSRRQIEDEVKFHLDRGRKSLDAGQIKAAKGHFEAILRLYHRDPQNPSCLEAREQLDRIRTLSGGAG